MVKLYFKKEINITEVKVGREGIIKGQWGLLNYSWVEILTQCVYYSLYNKCFIKAPYFLHSVLCKNIAGLSWNMKY